MNLTDTLHHARRALGAQALRSVLIVLAMAIGSASVVVLAALGDGARAYVRAEFLALGTHLLIVLPGRSETRGSSPPLMGETPRSLTLADAATLGRSAAIRRYAPLVIGSAPLSHGALDRDAVVLGTSADYIHLRRLPIAQGRFISTLESDQSASVCVLGHTLRKELFGNAPAVGSFVRIGDRRLRVIGALAPTGQALGFDMDEVAIIPVGAAQSLFNVDNLFRILVEARSRVAIETAREDIRRTIRARHEGEDDVTIITQDALLATFDRILRALTLALAGIATISLIVAGILIMNVMLVAVTQRRAEIGLMKALGASRRDIARAFLAEAALLASAGALIGITLGVAGCAAIRAFYPQIPVYAPAWSLAAALITALLVGIVSGVLPARRAARLDAVAALARR
jgi:putative ABC transport system permease protein